MSQDYLIVSDVDGTLLGDDPSLVELAAWLSRRRDHYRLAYASGRFFNSIYQSIRQTPLPEPDFVISGVGTEICDYRSGVRACDWPGIPPAAWSDCRARQALATIPRLVEQPAEFQSYWKLSYYLADASAEELAFINRQLAAAGVEADVVYSSQLDLDVLPRGINKGSAAQRLAARLGVPAERVIVCGDTGNDLAMFRCGFRGIIVGNARPELKENAGGAVYHARQPHAAGVHEGLQYWLEAADPQRGRDSGLPATRFD